MVRHNFWVLFQFFPSALLGTNSHRLLPIVVWCHPCGSSTHLRTVNQSRTGRHRTGEWEPWQQASTIQAKRHIQILWQKHTCTQIIKIQQHLNTDIYTWVRLLVTLTIADYEGQFMGHQPELLSNNMPADDQQYCETTVVLAQVCIRTAQSEMNGKIPYEERECTEVVHHANCWMSWLLMSLLGKAPPPLSLSLSRQ